VAGELFKALNQPDPSCVFAAVAAADSSRGFMVFQLLACMRRLLFVPEGQTILAQQFIAGKGSLCRMSAVGTAEYPPEFHRSEGLQPSLIGNRAHRDLIPLMIVAAAFFLFCFFFLSL